MNSSLNFILGSLVVAGGLYMAANYYDEIDEAQERAETHLMASLDPSDSSSIDEKEEKDGAPDIHINVHHNTGTNQQYSTSGEGVPQDARILNNIGSLLGQAYSGYNLSVHIENGVVTISGVVKTTEDILDIQNSIMRIPGVKSVNNQLYVLKQQRTKK